MTLDEFYSLKIGDIVSNKTETIDCNNNNVIIGYDYIVSEIANNVVYLAMIMDNGEIGSNPHAYEITANNIERCIGLHIENNKKLYNLVLYLNNDGIRAINSNTKNIQIVTDHVTDADIDKIFPISLVDHYDVDNSLLMRLKVGDLCKVIDTEPSCEYMFVGKVSRTTNACLYVDLLYNLQCKKLCYGNYSKKFNKQGISVGDNKRYTLSDVSEDEIIQYTEASELDKIYNVALELMGVDVESYKNSYDVMEPVKPDYLDTIAAKRILAILKEAKSKK